MNTEIPLDDPERFYSLVGAPQGHVEHALGLGNLPAVRWAPPC